MRGPHEEGKQGVPTGSGKSSGNEAREEGEAEAGGLR